MANFLTSGPVGQGPIALAGGNVNPYQLYALVGDTFQFINCTDCYTDDSSICTITPTGFCVAIKIGVTILSVNNATAGRQNFFVAVEASQDPNAYNGDGTYGADHISYSGGGSGGGTQPPPSCAIYNSDNPAGFDLQVLRIQQKLASLNFMEYIFGVAHVQVALSQDNITQDNYLIPDMGKKGVMKHERWYPQGKKRGEDIDLSFDDSYASRVFFMVKDPISASPSQSQYSWGDQSPEIRQPFSLICHFNIDKITNMNLDINSREQVKLSIIYALSQAPKIILNNMSENINNVFKEFSITPDVNGVTRDPYYCLRLECDAYYYALPMNGGTEEYQPSINYDSSINITPNTDAGTANVN